MATRRLDKVPDGLRWYTPTHRLWVVGKGDGIIVLSRRDHPSFIVASDDQSEAEKEAGRIINHTMIHLGRQHGHRSRTSSKATGLS